MMMLMDKGAKENDEIGLSRVGQWSKLAADFLPMTIISTPNDLKQVCCQNQPYEHSLTSL